MTKITKRILIGSSVGLGGLVLMISFFYLSSIFSDYYNSEPVSAETHLSDLREFKHSFEKNFQETNVDNIDELSIKRTQYVLDLVEEKLLSKEPSSISIEDLDHIAHEARITMKVLHYESAYKNYFSDEKQFLVDSIYSLRLLQDIMYDLKQEKVKQEQLRNKQ